MPKLSIGRLRGGFCVYWTKPDGKRSRHSLSARTRAEAEAEAIDVWRRETINHPTSTVGDIWEAYRQDTAGRPISTTMKYTGKPVLNHFGHLRPDLITVEASRSYTAARRKAGRSDGTILTELGHLSIALNWAKKRGLITSVPAIDRPSKPAPSERSFTLEEIKKLLESDCSPHIMLAMLMTLSTAGRVSAILELTWDRVDLDASKSIFAGRQRPPAKDGLSSRLMPGCMML